MSAAIHATTLPPWLERAYRDLTEGVREVSGELSHARIQAMLESVRFGSDARDSIPWCAAAVNKWVEEAGLRGTKSGLARSWLEWGQEIEFPPEGAICVLSRGQPPKGHVGLYLGAADYDGEGNVSEVLLLGGNQSDQVCIRTYAASRVIGYRWPKGVRA